ncbi:hypothetical protein P1X15_32290 [Runella sp. MFBS21]|uniref:hypothetical protein n=1 Tax=Runella sp. MFBS21 TaxID=3034018 RepID=UPI0023F96F49|nr:hypothetical protein [Runella sp. MFBS21]MDF7822337.1 hypothetical protein [Runella sp. MFBS21]
MCYKFLTQLNEHSPALRDVLPVARNSEFEALLERATQLFIGRNITILFQIDNQ